MHKASKEDASQRVDEVESWLLEGKTRSNILRLASSWQLTDRQVDTYIEKAWEIIQEVNRASRPQHVSRHMKRLDSIALRAMEKGDLNAEIKARDLQAKILGLELAPAEQAPRLEFPDEALDQVISQELVH